MTYRKIVIACLTVLMALACRVALAWNSIGHMSVAYAAYQQLTPAEKARVAALVQLNPNYNEWVSNLPKGISDADKNLYLFMIAATWPDQIRAMGSGFTGTDAPPRGEDPSLNDGYAAKKAHKYWHFVNTPLGGNTPNPAPLSVPTAAQKIAAFRAALASKEPDLLKSYDLVWLIHLVGDVHQPLHCVTRVSAANPKGDEGGNAVKVSGPAGDLHAFWDGALGEGEWKEFLKAVSVGEKLPAPDAAKVSDDKEGDWTAESYALAKSDVYVDPVGPGTDPYTLTAAYTANAQGVAQERVALAGARLANLLKTALQCGDQTCAN